MANKINIIKLIMKEVQKEVSRLRVQNTKYSIKRVIVIIVCTMRRYIKWRGKKDG